MLKLYRVIGLLVFIVAALPIFAGGSDVTEPQSTNRTTGRTSPTTIAVHAGSGPQATLDARRHRYVPGEWSVAASAIYQDGPGLGAGLAYRWPHGVTLIGQVTYTDPNGCDGATVRADELDRRGLVTGNTNPPQPPRYVTCPGCDGERWGGVVTILVPIGRR